MPFYKENVDLYFTSEGDLFIDSDRGDLEDTKLHQYRCTIQQIFTRLSSTKGDWREAPEIGASLGDFLGSPNVRATGDLIIARIQSELAREGLITSSDLSVDVIPLDKNTIMILVSVTPPGSSQAIYINFTYNMSENKLVPRNT